MMNRRKFIKVTATAAAAVPLTAYGIPLFGELAHDNQEFKKNLEVDFDSEGGYLVPREIAEMIEKKLLEIDPTIRITNEPD
jgi:hypothetical protein